MIDFPKHGACSPVVSRGQHPSTRPMHGDTIPFGSTWHPIRLQSKVATSVRGSIGRHEDPCHDDMHGRILSGNVRATVALTVKHPGGVACRGAIDGRTVEVGGRGRTVESVTATGKHRSGAYEASANAGNEREGLRHTKKVGGARQSLHERLVKHETCSPPTKRIQCDPPIRGMATRSLLGTVFARALRGAVGELLRAWYRFSQRWHGSS